MNREEYERMYRLEDTYWWFVGRHNLALGYLQDLLNDRTDAAILDLGCGTGAMSRKLERWGAVISADFSPLALSYSRARGLRLLCASDAERLPFRNGSFDVVVALDILEHVRDDRRALAEVRRVLKPGGTVVATVPAYPSLWSGHDVALMHHRRYLACEVRERFTEAGMRIRKLSHAMTLLYPAVWLYRRLAARDRKPPAASLVPVPAPLNRLLVGILALENVLIRIVSLPFGVTVLCVAEREA